jgi:hypothetical protein
MDARRARCAERCTPGSGGGPRETAGRKAGAALAGLPHRRRMGPRTRHHRHRPPHTLLRLAQQVQTHQSPPDQHPQRQGRPLCLPAPAAARSTTQSQHSGRELRVCGDRSSRPSRGLAYAASKSPPNQDPRSPPPKSRPSPPRSGAPVRPGLTWVAGRRRSCSPVAPDMVAASMHSSGQCTSAGNALQKRGRHPPRSPGRRGRSAGHGGPGWQQVAGDDEFGSQQDHCDLAEAAARRRPRL